MLQAVLLGLLAFVGRLDWAIGASMMHRPIVCGALTGLIMGDLQTGIIIGGTLEIFFMGSIAIGAYTPPDVNVGGILGTALAIKLGMGAEMAVTLALPTAIFSAAFYTLEMATVRVFVSHKADTYAERGEVKKVYLMHWIGGLVSCFRAGTIVFVAYLIGSTKMQEIVNAIPEQIIQGMTIATGMLPAIGIALLMRMIVNKKLIPYLVLGFVLSAYLNVPIIGIAIIGVIIIFAKFDFDGAGSRKAVAAAEVNMEVDEDDF